MSTKAQNMQRAKAVRRELRLRERYLSRLSKSNDDIAKQLVHRKELYEAWSKVGAREVEPTDD